MIGAARAGGQAADADRRGDRLLPARRAAGDARPTSASRPTRTTLGPVAEAACAEGETIHNEPFAVTPDMVVAALLAATRSGPSGGRCWSARSSFRRSARRLPRAERREKAPGEPFLDAYPVCRSATVRRCGCRCKRCACCRSSWRTRANRVRARVDGSHDAQERDDLSRPAPAGVRGLAAQLERAGRQHPGRAPRPPPVCAHADRVGVRRERGRAVSRGPRADPGRLHPRARLA